MTSSAETFTYWSLLGLSPSSDPNQLKQAFKREAKIWHPDLNKGCQNAEERFKWINEAYLVLSDPRKRFEWEVAGRPGFEIKEFEKSARTSHLEQKQNTSDNGDTPFSSSEKILILLIALAIIFPLNAFLF